jgi:hypothetical protein
MGLLRGQVEQPQQPGIFRLQPPHLAAQRRELRIQDGSAVLGFCRHRSILSRA